MLIKDPPVELSDNLLMLGSNEYPLFLFRGESGGTIIEGGTSTMGPLLARQLDQLGIGKDYVKQAIITHAHPDHVMAIPLFREMFPGITVLASELAARTLASTKAMSFFLKIDAAFTEALTREGIVTGDHQPPQLAGDQIAVDRTLKDGDVIAVDTGVSFEVLETPGHSDCSLSFHEPGNHVLIISDATGYYIPEQEYWWPNYFTGYAAYLESMERLAVLHAEILCLSHNAVIKGAGAIGEYFHGAITVTREYHERIVTEVRAGKDPKQLAGELGSEVYEKTQLLPLDFFQKNCSLLVKQSLEHAESS